MHPNNPVTRERFDYSKFVADNRDEIKAMGADLTESGQEFLYVDGSHDALNEVRERLPEHEMAHFDESDTGIGVYAALQVKIPWPACTCGNSPGLWSTDGFWTVRCGGCGRTTKEYHQEVDAWEEWLNPSL